MLSPDAPNGGDLSDEQETNFTGPLGGVLVQNASLKISLCKIKKITHYDRL